MNRLTNEQRLQIIEFYYQNQCSVRNVFRALRPIYGLHNRPSEQTINAIVTKFRTQFTLLDIRPTTRMRTVRTEENIASVSASVTEDREMSIRHRSQQLGLCYSTTRKILRNLEKNNNSGKKMADRPKRPLSAYMLWLNESREQIKKENPGIKVTEIAKKGGELWRAMKDKSEWEAKAAKIKDEYTKAVKEYEANGGTDTGSKRKSKATKKPAKKAKKKESEDEESGGEEGSD